MSTLSLWTRRDPFADFDAIVRRSFVTPAVRPAAFVPPAELARQGDDAVVRLEIPGLDVETDVTIEVEANRLVIKGEKRDERSDERGTRTIREVRYGSFRRSFTLPDHVATDAITASYDAGVLSVRVAGVYAQPEPQVTRIAVTAGAPAPSPAEPQE